MNKFKVGDRVVCHKFQTIPNGINWAPEMNAIEGKTGTIKRPTHSILDGWIVHIDGANCIWSFPASALTLVPQPHKHAKLIKAWADGAVIECLVGHRSNPYWVVVPNPAWNSSDEYRVRVQPKPDIVRYARAWAEHNHSTCWTDEQTDMDNIKATFDGETGKLKAVELLS